MTIYIALLRGINVGGHNKMKMADLKELFVQLGFSNVNTYIQSGNVVFISPDESQVVQKCIEEAIKRVFGISLTVVIRTASELENIIENCPYSEEDRNEEESISLSFLDSVPLQEGINKLKAIDISPDQYHIEGENVYLLFRQSIRNSKLATQLTKLGVSGTIRNWRTVNKLWRMAKDLQNVR